MILNSIAVFGEFVNIDTFYTIYYTNISCIGILVSMYYSHDLLD